jgi:hypothetical protein
VMLWSIMMLAWWDMLEWLRRWWRGERGYD